MLSPPISLVQNLNVLLLRQPADRGRPHMIRETLRDLEDFEWGRVSIQSNRRPPEFAIGWGDGSALGRDLDANSISCEYRILSEGLNLSQWKLPYVLRCGASESRVPIGLPEFCGVCHSVQDWNGVRKSPSPGTERSRGDGEFSEVSTILSLRLGAIAFFQFPLDSLDSSLGGVS